MTERRRGMPGGPDFKIQAKQEETMTDSEIRLADLEVRISQLETEPSLRERGRGLMARIVPPEASRHFRNAGREQLLGVRSIVDHWIRKIDESEKAQSGARHEKIEIE